MKRIQAELIAGILNLSYRGPSPNVSAFSAVRSVSTDSEGFWDYYISTPFGVFRRDTGEEVSFSEQRRLVRDVSLSLGMCV